MKKLFAKTIYLVKKDLGLIPPEPRPEEMFPGVVRPSYALAGIVAAKVLQNPMLLKQKTEYGPENAPSYRDSWNLLTTTWESGDLAIKATKKTFYSSSYDVRKIEVRFKDALYDFGEDDKVIREAINTAIEQKRELERNKKESDRQQRACDLIESFFNTNQGEVK